MGANRVRIYLDKATRSLIKKLRKNEEFKGLDDAQIAQYVLKDALFKLVRDIKK